MRVIHLGEGNQAEFPAYRSTVRDDDSLVVIVAGIEVRCDDGCKLERYESASKTVIRAVRKRD